MEIKAQMIKKECPECKSPKTQKVGTYMTRKGRKQRFRCDTCGHIWNLPLVAENSVTK
jgi:transposase-like protein